MNTHKMSNDRRVRTEMLQDLPEPVQRYMTYTGVVGQPWIRTVYLKQAGRFRLGQDRPWMPMLAEQCFTTNPPGFVWKARFKMARLWLLSAQDTYKAGHGRMFGKVARIFTVFDVQGAEIDQGAMLRYLGEMIWFPIAFLGENITWQGIDTHSAQVTLTDGDKSVSAHMFFDDTGRPTDFVAQRYREISGSFSLDSWSALTTGYGVRAGLNLPIRGQAVWKLPSGDLPYWDGEITEVEYNGPVEPF